MICGIVLSLGAFGIVPWAHALDGAALYGRYCVGCHGPLATSAMLGRTATQIQNAIATVSQMSGLSTLTQAQIDAIAAALGADSTAPTVTAFSIPATSSSLTVTITTFTAVTAYLITESSTTPSASATGWRSTPPTTCTASASGARTLYAWAKDAVGDVSFGVSAATTISTSSGGLDLTVWLGTWFKITEKNTGYQYANPTINRANASYTGYLKIWNWDPANRAFQADRYEQDVQTGQWVSYPFTLRFLAGTQYNFLCWSQESAADHTTGLTARIQGQRKNGELQKATFKSLGGYYAESVNGSGAGAAPLQQDAGGLSVTGNLIPETKVPVPGNLLQH